MKSKFKVPFITSLVALMSMVTGCGLADNKPDLNVDVSSHDDITLKTYFPNFGVQNKKIRDGWLANAIREQTGYKVDFNQFSTSMDTEVNKFLNTREPIDMMKVGGTIFNNYVTNGYFTDLTDVIEKYGDVVVKSDGTTFKNLFTEEQWAACSYNGRIYAIPEIGHTAMADQAIIWNRDHLKLVGIDYIPTTIGQIDDALTKLEAYFGPKNKNYYALGLYGTIPVNNPLSCAFEVPGEWWVDENGDLQNVIHSTQWKTYITWMNSLLNKGYIAGDWVSQSETHAMNNFVKQNCSAYIAAYWNITPVREMLVSTYESFPEDMVLTSDKRNYVYGESKMTTLKDDALLSWTVYVTGDGTHGSIPQEKGVVREGPTKVGYYITVPVVNAKRAAYVIDWVCKKNTEEMTITMVAGKEGKHYEFTTSDDPDAIKLFNDKNQYVKLHKEDFLADISGMSQFQTSVNMDIAREWWPVAEAGFNAWNVLVLDENNKEDRSRVIENPFGYHPVLEKFAKVDLEAQNFVITQAQALINASPDALDSNYQKARNDYNTRFYNICKDEINTWYKANH